MPRDKGTRKALKSGAKIKSTARVVDTEGVEEGKEEPEAEVEENECDDAVERNDVKLPSVLYRRRSCSREHRVGARERDGRAGRVHQVCRAGDCVSGNVEGAQFGGGGLVVLGVPAGAR